MRSHKIKLVVSALAAAYAAYYATTASQWHFIDNLDLMIHEAGHAIFSFFGEFIHVLMGSGFQILFPLCFVIYFFLRGARWSASIALYWVGFNILNVAIYAADAVREQLPLLGNGEHDWHWIFDTLNVLGSTKQISSAMFAVGICALFLAAVGSFYFVEES